MKKINFYIGSNNKTHELEKEKAIKIIAEEYEGFSVSELLGYWKSKSERTLLIMVVINDLDLSQVKRVCKKINKELEQEAVMVEILESNTLFID